MLVGGVETETAAAFATTGVFGATDPGVHAAVDPPCTGRSVAPQPPRGQPPRPRARVGFVTRVLGEVGAQDAPLRVKLLHRTPVDGGLQHGATLEPDVEVCTVDRSSRHGGEWDPVFWHGRLQSVHELRVAGVAGDLLRLRVELGSRVLALMPG